MSESDKQTDSEKHRVVLVAIDGSSQSEYAYEWYRNHVRQASDKVIFVNIAEPHFSGPPVAFGMEYTPPSDIKATMQESIQSSIDLCNEWMARAQKQEIKAEGIVRADNRPAHAFLHTLTECQANLAIMGTRGLGKFRRTILGSFSDYVIHHANIPVIVVPYNK